MIPTASLPFSTPAPKLGRLLVVDDEVELMTALREMLTRQGYEAVGFTSGANGRRVPRSETKRGGARGEGGFWAATCDLQPATWRVAAIFVG